MEISVAELRRIMEKLFIHLNEKGVDSFLITHDYYWHIPFEELYDPYKKPNNLNLGQLSDDWQDLKKVIEGDNDPVVTDFIDIASIFREIGEQGE